MKLHTFLTSFFASEILQPMAKEFKETPDRFALVNDIVIDVDFRKTTDVRVEMKFNPTEVAFVGHIPMNDLEEVMGHGMTLNGEVETFLLLAFITMFTLSCISNLNDKKITFKGESPLSHMLTDSDFFMRAKTLVQKLKNEFKQHCDFSVKAPNRVLTLTRSELIV